ncbi:hypothetical protein GGX14DRAFT_431909 [Mycena pura]|uniref:Uncharacterized protein n=1 Tax=Mycena pura TaxID=153505 RepID=A0AAD6YKK5_9AGAR|nr:hypothetical protein GGX14DRAFT_431909 [Mycena pura]
MRPGSRLPSLPMRPGSRPASAGALLVNASLPPLPPLRPTTAPDASSASPAAPTDPNLPPGFPTQPCHSASTLRRPSAPPATPMPPDALSSASESHPHLNPLSVPLHPSYAEPDGRCATPLPVTTRQKDTRQMCRAAHTLEDPCAACELQYDLFATETLFDPAVADETPPRAVVNELAEECRGEVFTADCVLQSLIGGYLEGRSPLAGDNPQLDLKALASPPRRSARLFAARLAAEAKQCLPKPQPLTPMSTAKPSRRNAPAPGAKPQRKAKASKPNTPANTRPWINAAGELIQPEASWAYAPPPSAAPLPLPHPSLPARPACPTPLTVTALHPSLPSRPANGPPPEEPPAKRHCSRGHRPEKRAEQKVRRSARRGDTLASNNFSIIKNASVSSTGFQGTAPPPLARKKIDRLYGNEPDARGLHQYLQYFFPCYYDLRDSPRDERATFFVDRDGLIFMYRSFRVAELMARADEVQHAHDILVGSDRTNKAWREHYREGQRGDHIAIIFGHHRQSAQAPRLTKWHLDHMERVNEFMQLPIVKALIGIVSDIVTTVFPGVATRFLADAEWHWRRYGIKPMFGLFWNLCLNAWFPGQRRIHCRPHADKKNQIGVCVLLIYVLKTALQFDHRRFTWLVIWEAGVAVELPPWVILIYPSALFYHFNLDVSQIEFVTTDGCIRPTPQNSRPIVNGDNEGRGSFVFFNQSTMRTGPETGCDTLKKARAAGLSGISDFGASAQEAFSRPEYFHKISPLF